MQSGPHCVCVFVRRRERERERELLQSRSINSSNGFDPSRLTAAINIKASLLCLPSSRTTLRGGVQAPVCAHVCVCIHTHMAIGTKKKRQIKRCGGRRLKNGTGGHTCSSAVEHVSCPLLFF